MIVKTVTHYSLTHSYQSSFNTCGPTSLKMVMSSYWFFETEDYFKQLCQTKSLWTSSDDLCTAIEFLWGHYRMFIGWTLNQVQEYIDLWYKIIVWYGYGRGIVWHYAVCKEVDSKHIYLDDPIHWVWHTYWRYYFEKEMWNLGSHRDWKRWFVAIKFWNLKLVKKDIEKIEKRNESRKPVFIDETIKKKTITVETINLDSLPKKPTIMDPYYVKQENKQMTMYDDKFWEFWTWKK